MRMGTKWDLTVFSALRSTIFSLLFHHALSEQVFFNHVENSTALIQYDYHLRFVMQEVFEI
jgi:hypothetical protein